MKKRPSLSPIQLLWCVALLVLFVLLILSLYKRNKEDPLSDQTSFNKLTRELFAAEMSSNTLNMHYSLAYPENYGILSYEPVLPAYQSGSYEQSRDAIRHTLNALTDIDPDHLSGQDAYLYKLLQRKLENSLQLNSYPYYDEPLSPSSGIQSQLPILLAEYTFRERRDVEDYLALLDQVDSYFASILTFEQEKAAAGLSQSSYSLEQVKEQCDTIVTKTALEDGTHFLQTTFAERLLPLVEKGEITSKEAQNYIAQNNRLLRTVVQPAYETLADGLFLLEDSEGVPALPSGLASRPEGKEYYSLLLISETGSRRSVGEIKALLEQTLAEEYDAMRELLIQHPELKEPFHAGTYTDLPYSDAESILSDLRERMRTDFPTLPEIPSPVLSGDMSGLPGVTVKPVSPNLQEYCAPAFYLTAPLDDTDNNVIYINAKNSPDSLELYTTLAHEGFPGHLYQTVYHNRSALNSGENNVRQLLWYGGYLEGWALYVEFYSYDYVEEMFAQQGRSEDALCVRLEKHNRSLLLCLYSILDVMIHYDNASIGDVAQYLSSFGIENEDAVTAVYNYIADDPCNYPKYYLGFLEIQALKKAARQSLGSSYSDYSFHSFLLDAGPSDFTSLEELMDTLTNSDQSPMIAY